MEIIEKIILWYKRKILRRKVMRISVDEDAIKEKELQDERERFTKTCSVCNKKLDIYSHKCPYCKKWHCYEHLLPETHKCPNPGNPYGLNMGK